MKKRLVVAVVWLAIGLGVPAFAQQKDTIDPRMTQQIREVTIKYDAAFNSHDASAVAALYTKNGVEVTDTGPVKGREAIEKSYAHDFQSWHPSNRATTVDRVMAIGNEVRARGRWSESLNDNGSLSKHEGYYSWIMVREGDNWKIHRSTFSGKIDTHQE